MNIKRFLLTRPLALMVMSLWGVLASCGGGTSGSGGITIDGRLLTQTNSPVVGVMVTDQASGDADITNSDGRFALIAERAAEFGLLFEGQGLNTTSTITDVPGDASKVTATFRASVEQNSVVPDEVVIERPPASYSSSSISSTTSNSSAGSSNDSASNSSDQNSSSSLSSPSSSGSSSDDDSSNSSSSGDSSSSSQTSNSGSSSSENSSSSTGSEVRRTGPIQAISSSVVRVSNVNFIPQPSTRFEDEEGEDTALENFAVGELVEARGSTSGGQVLLERLRKED